MADGEKCRALGGIGAVAAMHAVAAHTAASDSASRDDTIPDSALVNWRGNAPQTASCFLGSYLFATQPKRFR